MSSRDLLAFFADRKHAPLVLASVYDTLGSTYSKPGARMLITGDGDFQGMLSGGCLEGDLVLRARQVAEHGEPQLVTYDLRRNEEELWGLGVGCDGLMRIFLQRLAPASGHEPFATMSRVLGGERVGIAATVLESDDPDTRPGAALVGASLPLDNLGVAPPAEAAIETAAAEVLAAGRSERRRVVAGGHTFSVLFSVLRPPPRVLVLGAGLDAEPVVRLCGELGWRVMVQDHRPAYVEKGDFASAEAVTCRPAGSLAGELDLERFDAAIVMSHHLDSDRMYLELLATSAVPYVGLLGPRERRRRLVEELGVAAKSLEHRLHGPAGLDIGGRGPASIALSIVAEMHQVLMGRDGGG